MEQISRQHAKINGLSKYFTGVPCSNGHVTYRYTKSGACSLCVRGIKNKTSHGMDIRRDAVEIMEVAKNQVAVIATDTDRTIKQMKADTAAAVQFMRDGLARDIESLLAQCMLKRKALIDAAEAQARGLISNLATVEASNFQANIERAIAFGEMVVVRPLATPETVDIVKAKLMAIVSTRCSSITVDDVWAPNQRPDWGGIRYHALCPKSEASAFIRDTNKLFHG